MNEKWKVQHPLGGNKPSIPAVASAVFRFLEATFSASGIIAPEVAIFAHIWEFVL